MQSLKAAAILLAAAFLCVTYAPPAAARQQPEGAPWKKLRVEFEGNHFFASEQLRKATEHCLGLHNDEGEEIGPEMLDYCLRKDVVEVMRRAGYVRAELGKPRTADLGDAVTVTVPVEENELYRVGRIKIEGASHFDTKQLRELLPLKRGDIADSITIGRWAFDHLKKKYADEGFIQYESDITPEYRTEPGASEGALDLTITVNEGKRFTVRRVEFDGAAGAPVDVLREALGLKEGKVFKQQEYRDGVANLNHLELFDRDGRFEDVDREKDVWFQTNEETGELDITIHLTEKGQERAARRVVRPAAEEGEARPGRPSLVRRP